MYESEYRVRRLRDGWIALFKRKGINFKMGFSKNESSS